jgi:hypothetical protein
LLLHLNQISPNKEEETDNSYNKREGPKQSEMINLDVSCLVLCGSSLSCNLNKKSHANLKHKQPTTFSILLLS